MVKVYSILCLMRLCNGVFAMSDVVAYNGVNAISLNAV